MCRKLALLATVLILAPGAALAAARPQPPPAAAPPSPARPAARPAPTKATPEQRAEAERLDPLGRAAFWAREFNVDPRDFEAGVKLAKALRALGRYDEAASAAEQVLVMQPTNVEALLEAGRAYVGAGRGFYAIDPAQRAAAQAPRDWRPVALLAVALEQADRNDEALAAHEKALQLAPDNPAALTNLGLYYASHGQPQKAEPLLRRAAASPSAGAQERQNLALVLGLEGKLDEAERLERQDLPPEVVESNLAYLRATPATPRSWDALRSAQ